MFRHLRTAIRRLLPILVTAVAFADSLDLAYTVVGSGGFGFSPREATSGQPHWWVDQTGGLVDSALAPYGFNPLVGFPIPVSSISGGSILLSEAFTLGADSTLSVSMNIVSTRAEPPIFDMGFAALLQNSIVREVLVCVSPRWGVYVPPPPGVTVTTSQPPLPSSAVGIEATGSMTADGGVYQLLFGAFNLGGGAGPGNGGTPIPTSQSFVTVNAVTATPVPEANPVLLYAGNLGLLLATAVVARRQKRKSSR
jgi:hypothetical protein